MYLSTEQLRQGIPLWGTIRELLLFIMHITPNWLHNHYTNMQTKYKHPTTCTDDEGFMTDINRCDFLTIVLISIFIQTEKQAYFA